MNKKLLIAPICGIAMVIGGAFLWDIAPRFNAGSQAIITCGIAVAFAGIIIAVCCTKIE